MRQEELRRYIYAIFVLALTVRLGYAFVTPPFQAPDEYSHYSYVRFIHESHQLPVQPSTTTRPEQLQFHQPPLYYTLTAPLFPSTKLIEGRPSLPLRLTNILLAMLALWAAYRFALTIWPDSPFCVAVSCACFALLPTFSYTSSTIRNGVLATFLSSVGFYLCAKNAKIFRANDGRQVRWAGIGVIGGLAVLSKLTAMGFVAGAGLTMLMAADSRRTLLRRAGWFALGFLSVTGWWFVRNWFVYGHWVTVVETGFESTHTDLNFYLHVKSMLIVLFKTFWAVFGRINEIYFQDIYRFCWWFSGLAVLGLIRYAIQKRNDIPRELLAGLAGAIAVSFALTTYYAYNYDSDQGRYMFPVLIPITTFIAAGFNSLVPARYHRLALDSMLFALAGINTLVISRLAAIYW